MKGTNTERDRSVPEGVPSETPCRVILWDEQRHRQEEICKVIESATLQPVATEDSSDCLRTELSANCFLAVANTGTAPGGLGMQIIHHLSAKGFKVIAYEDGAQCWPIKLKCLPLLAGAIQLFDSSSPDFARQLRETVGQITRVEAQRQSEADNITKMMLHQGLVGVSAAMMSVFRTVARFSTLSDLPVLIVGETGTGKEALARAVHSLDSKRNKGPFVPVNCGAVSKTLVESEFFGHRRGAFTGAERERKGLIRSAEGGVLFLDEIAELDFGLQNRLLRVLQENRVLSVGEDREVEVSVRIVAATNQDLRKLVRENKFRSDLFHRLNVLPILVPPLRERPDDLEPLLEHFVQKYRSLNPSPPAVESDFVAALRAIQFPGNVRELENLVRYVLITKRDHSPLNLSDLPQQILRELVDKNAIKTPPDSRSDMSTECEERLRSDPGFLIALLEANQWRLPQTMGKCERSILEVALQRSHGNQCAMARLLGVTPRTVYNKLLRHGLDH